MRVEMVMIVHQPPRLLLGLKKSKFGKGRYNGFGGGMEYGETIEECAVRETAEECSIIVLDPIQLGRILFIFSNDRPDHLVYFFKATDFKKEPIETKEMKPEWFPDNEIPYAEMWDSDKYWMPLLLKNKRFAGIFLFSLNDKVKEHALYILN